MVVNKADQYGTDEVALPQTALFSWSLHAARWVYTIGPLFTPETKKLPPISGGKPLVILKI